MPDAPQHLIENARPWNGSTSSDRRRFTHSAASSCSSTAASMWRYMGPSGSGKSTLDEHDRLSRTRRPRAAILLDGRTGRVDGRKTSWAAVRKHEDRLHLPDLQPPWAAHDARWKNVELPLIYAPGAACPAERDGRGGASSPWDWAIG